MSIGATISSEGTSQKQRGIQALSQPNVKVDERFFNALVKEIHDHAKLLNFYEPGDIKSGTSRKKWGLLLERDEIVILCQMSLLPYREIEDYFHAHLALAKSNVLAQNSKQHLFYALSAINKIGKHYLSWHKILSAQSINPQIKVIFQEWDMAMKNSASVILRGPDGQEKPHYTLLQALNALSRWEKSAEKEESKFPFKDHEDVGTFFRTLINTCYFLKSKYAQFMKVARSHQNHEPHVALLFTFAQLVEVVQEKLNTFPKRLLHHYYEKLLGLAQAKATPDTAYLHFTLEDSIQDFTLQKGTRFIGGMDDVGDPIFYELTHSLPLDQRKIRQLFGIQVAKDENLHNVTVDSVTGIQQRNYGLDPQRVPAPLMKLNAGDQAELTTAGIGFAISSPHLALAEGDRRISIDFMGEPRFHCLTREIMAKLPATRTASKLTLEQIFNAFGEETPSEIPLITFFDKYFTVGSEPSGICVSSYFIEEALSDPGVAEMIIGSSSKHCTGDSSFEELIVLLEKKTNLKRHVNPRAFINSLVEKQSERSSRDKKTRAKEIARKFRMLFLEAFSISYSTAESWQKVKPVSVDFEQNPSRKGHYALRVILHIDSEKPGLAANSALGFPHACIRFLLNPWAHQYPYDFMRLIHPTRIKFHIGVRKVKNLTLYNQIGQINADASFYPFGPTPNTYSFLLIGNKELFRKQLTKLKLHVDWMDLPQAYGGFPTHYALYPNAYENSSFKARVSQLSAGNWTPEPKNQQDLTLFDCNEYLRSSMTYAIDVNSLNLNTDFSWDPEDLVYNNSTERGFLKVQLASPKQSFGHEEYPGLLSKIVMESAKKMTRVISSFVGKKNELTLPEQPYTPKIGGISLDYESNFEISFRDSSESKERRDHLFYHIEPQSGYRHIEGNGFFAPLIPTYPYEGAFHIGLDKLSTPASISLFFNLAEQEVDLNAQEYVDAEIAWSYLVKNEWVKLKPHEVSRDTTLGLVRSGIVRLEIPKIRATNNTILPDHLLWIRASCKRGIHVLGKLIFLTNHAEEVVYLNHKGANYNVRLESHAIAEAEFDIPQIANINQPLPSFGGKVEESEEQWIIRVSERLRHKNRSVNQYDYERLILQQFPEINKALCVNAHDWRHSKRKAGHVLLVVVPKIAASHFDPSAPTNSVYVLKRIGNYISQLSSPFVKFQIINPVYEPIRVFASVKIESGFAIGESVRNLEAEIKAYLAPWTVDKEAEPMFNRTVTSEQVQAFIQARPYVSFVTKVSLVKRFETVQPIQLRPYRISDTAFKDQPVSQSGKLIRGAFPWSILTTAKQHMIDVIQGEDFYASEVSGLGDLFIDEDYVVPTNRKK